MRSSTCSSFKSSFSNIIASLSKTSSALLHVESLLIWGFSMFKMTNSICLASNKLVLWISGSRSIFWSWMWTLVIHIFFVCFWSICFVFFPVYTIMLIKVKSVVSLYIRKNDRFCLPSVIVVLSICICLSHSVKVVKSILERELVVELLRGFIFSWQW